MENQELQTLGQMRVRANFNPLESPVVAAIKQKTAELIDLVEADRADAPGEKHRLIALAQTAYEEAAMWAVKAATM